MHFSADDVHSDGPEDNRDSFNHDSFGAPPENFTPAELFDFAGQTAKFARDTSDVRKLSASASKIASTPSKNPSFQDTRNQTRSQDPFVATPPHAPPQLAQSHRTCASQLHQPFETISKRQLIVHNLPHNTSEVEIHEAFASVCPIENLLIRTSETAVRYACLTLPPSSKPLDVQNAVSAFDGKWYNDYQLNVQRADEVERWFNGSTRAPTDRSPPDSY
ncbi:hypothetical protein LTS18_005706 [Coniosporium uncinatum]|uniref:Uncharacterized protein n=1 Tax=Coniosporium uncinatum TaxID=93489 RepID=A0ACC3D4F7_9PEZI|nr:hypothetical protein LTS18_005706 [Coniosporium uncinatum]